MEKPRVKKCPYCSSKVRWCENKEIYGRNYGKSYMIWLCDNCKAYIGCHHNTKSPLGTLANKELREERKKTHAMFDIIWKEGTMTRKDAYKILNKHFGEVVHIGWTDIEWCKKIQNFLKPNPSLEDKHSLN